MTPMRFYGTPLPDVDLKPYPGKLIVIEGTDGVGRSTHIAELRTWLEAQGYAVADTGMTRSQLAGQGIKEAKMGHTLGKLTMQLFYATDFADRLDNEIIPPSKRVLSCLRIAMCILLLHALSRGVWILSGCATFIVYPLCRTPFFIFASIVFLISCFDCSKPAKASITGNLEWMLAWVRIFTTVSLRINPNY